MREILFKAKTKLEVGQNNGGKKDGVWVKGHYRDKVGRPTISQFEFDRADYIDYEIDRETLSQYTGLKDKHGNKIFENDIVKWDLENKKLHKASVKYYLGGFVYKQVPQGFIQDYPPHPMFIIDESKVEVIGNRFDNPELLGDKV